MIKYIDGKQMKNEIKKIIIDNGTTQKNVAEKMGMLPQTFVSMLNKQNISFNDVKRICDTMGIELYFEFRRKE